MRIPCCIGIITFTRVATIISNVSILITEFYKLIPIRDRVLITIETFEFEINPISNHSARLATPILHRSAHGVKCYINIFMWLFNRIVVRGHLLCPARIQIHTRIMNCIKVSAWISFQQMVGVIDTVIQMYHILRFGDARSSIPIISGNTCNCVYTIRRWNTVTRIIGILHPWNLHNSGNTDDVFASRTIHITISISTTVISVTFFERCCVRIICVSFGAPSALTGFRIREVW